MSTWRESGQAGRVELVRIFSHDQADRRRLRNWLSLMGGGAGWLLPTPIGFVA